MTLGQRIVVLNGGRIEQAGPPADLYNRPANLFVAGFLGTPKMNLLAGAIEQVSPGGVRVRLADGALIDVDAVGGEVGGKVTLGVRAEHLGPWAGQAGNRLQAQVAHVEYLGDQTIVYAAVSGSDQLIAARLPADTTAPEAGGVIALHAPSRRCHLFDASGMALPRTIAESCCPGYWPKTPRPKKVIKNTTPPQTSNAR